MQTPVGSPIWETVVRMDRAAAIEDAVNRCGGYADRQTLIRAVGRRSLESAVKNGQLRRIARGLYALRTGPPVDTAIAAEHGGVLFGLSAARHHGWEVLHEPTRVEVAVRHHRPIRQSKRVRVVRRALRDEEIYEGIVTSPVRTVLDCAATLPVEEALAVADSSLRCGAVDRETLLTLARRTRGHRHAATTRIATLADGRAANPFESVLRMRCLQADLAVEPQVRIRVGTRQFRVDLAAVDRRLVIEGDSFTYHASPAAFARDCVRYSELVTAGWLVLRMPYASVVHDPAWCAEVLSRVTAPGCLASSHIVHEEGPYAAAMVG